VAAPPEAVFVALEAEAGMWDMADTVEEEVGEVYSDKVIGMV
jgi:hypothetical protein